MSNVIIDKQKIDILANAISTKSGVPLTMTLDEMVEAVDGIQAGGNATLITKSITANGTYNASSDNADGYSQVTVNVSSGQSTLQSKSYNVSSAGTVTVTADSGYDGLSSVAVSVPQANLTNGVVSGEYVTQDNQRWFDATPILFFNAGWVSDNDYQFYPTRFYAIPSNTSITPTESSQTIGGANYMMEGAVTVNAIPSNYVGSGITQRSSTDLTVSGATVTAPAGYYSAAASKSVATMTLPTATASSATSGYTSKATIGRSTAAQYINIPSGYNSTGAYYVISATPNGSVTAPSSISGTTASVSTGTNTLTLTKTVSVTPNVTTAGYISSGTAGNSSVSLTASVTTKAAATITPTTTNQTIAADTYLTGTQTIAGDADLIGGNILSTANIFGVQGTVVVQNYYTGSSAPSSSTGSNGDLYLQS